jgi:hypothetical protein
MTAATMRVSMMLPNMLRYSSCGVLSLVTAR